jgi:hypothetical protein
MTSAAAKADEDLCPSFPMPMDTTLAGNVAILDVVRSWF